MSIYASMVEARSKGAKQLALLIDPDKAGAQRLDVVLHESVVAGLNYVFVGGSLLVNAHLEQCMENIRQRCRLPLVLFPGSPLQVSNQADGLLLLSLISGRNAELLIGHHVAAAPLLRESGLEIIPTGYLLIDGGAPTSVTYMSNTTPIPHDKPDIAVCTAMAGEMLGLKMLYLEAGSGALRPVSPAVISAVRKAVDLPLIVGGGIRSAEQALAAYQAGADLLVVGNGPEKSPELISEIQAVASTFAG